MNVNHAIPQVFFHVGLGKVASTYLQYRFFPYLQGIHYIQRTKYKKAAQIIEAGNLEKYLVSREFDRQLEAEVAAFAKKYPHTKSIILLRKQGSWIASQYRRYVKNGGALDFEQFIDLEGDKGEWRQKDLYFFPKIQYLEQHFSHRPLVLFYEDFKTQPFQFFDAIAHFLGVEYEQKAISLQKVHPSYKEKQLKIIRRLNPYLLRPSTKQYPAYWQQWLQKRSRMLVSYPVLYASLLIPDAWVNSEPLIAPISIQKVDNFYQKDWEQCLAYGRDG